MRRGRTHQKTRAISCLGGVFSWPKIIGFKRRHAVNDTYKITIDHEEFNTIKILTQAGAEPNNKSTTLFCVGINADKNPQKPVDNEAEVEDD